MTRRSPQVAGTGGFLVPLRLWKTELAAFAAQTGQRYLESLVGQEYFAAKHLPGLSSGLFAIIARPEVGEHEPVGSGCGSRLTGLPR